MKAVYSFLMFNIQGQTARHGNLYREVHSFEGLLGAFMGFGNLG